MRKYIAFLRAVNVGGTGKLPMKELRKMCRQIGLSDVQTYIASGNVVCASSENRKAVKAALEKQLSAYAGKDVGVVMRTLAELRGVLENNPFPDRDPKYTVTIFLDRKPDDDAVAQAVGQADEEMRIGNQEIYVHYGSGMGRSKLRIPAARYGTARNMNTVRKLVELATT